MTISTERTSAHPTTTPDGRPLPLAGVRVVDFTWIVAGPQATRILADFGADAIVRFDPAAESFTVYPLPHSGGNVRQLLGRPGEVWGAESAADHLVVIRTR